MTKNHGATYGRHNRTFPSTSNPLREPGLLSKLGRFWILAALGALSAAWTLQPPSASGQVVTASLQGNVQDGSGAAIAKAIVKATNTSTNVLTTATSDANGRFVFASLPPGGPYTITVESAGFKTEVRSGINLAVNQSAEITMVLQVGAASQQVEVRADASQLETSNAAMGQVISNRDIVNLPLNQRDVYSLAYLMPGVTGGVTYQYNSFNMSVDGGKPGSTLVLVDGIPASPPLIVPISGFAVFPSVDATEEFKVETNDYSAEFGRSGSGIIDVILKSGTNQLHGSAYEFITNSAIDANTFFNDRAHVPIPSSKRSQFGASLSGPVLFPKLYNGRNKTFFLFSYEGLRQGTESELTTTVPTGLQAKGDFSQTLNSAGQLVQMYDPATTVYCTGPGTPAPYCTQAATYARETFTQEYNEGPGNTADCGGDVNCIPSNRFDSVAAKVLQYYPPPNQTGTITGANNFFASGVSPLNIDTFDTRIDEVVNDKNRLFVRYSRRNLAQPPALFFPKQYQIGEEAYSQPQISNSAAIDYTRTPSPTFVMEIPFGFSRTALDFVSGSEGFNPSTELGFPGYIAQYADHLVFPGINPSSYYGLGDSGTGWTRHSGFNIYSLGIKNTKVAGNHVIKFGVETWLLQANDAESGLSTGNFSFSNAITQGPNPNAASSTAGNSIASLLLGVGSGSMVINNQNFATESHYFGAYFQDDWKVLPHLSVNLGLRYDLETPKTERYNRQNTFNPTIASPLAAKTGLTGLTGGLVFAGVLPVLGGESRGMFPVETTNFGPRIGASYELNKDTVVRAAYGVYYAPYINAAGAPQGNYGFSATTTYTGTPNGVSPPFDFLSNPFPTGVNLPTGSSLGLLTGVGSSVSAEVASNNKVGYTQNWELDIQRQLPGNILVDAAYVASHGVHLNQSGSGNWNLNQLSPTALSLGTGLQQSVTNPFYGFITTGSEAAATVPRSYLESSFPQYLSAYDNWIDEGYEKYNSFQLKVDKRLSRGLNMLVAYTGAKQLDDYSGIGNVGNITGGIQNIWNPKGENAVSSNNISRDLIVSGSYDLPFGKGRMFGGNWNRITNSVLGGWQINGIATEQNGFPLSPTTQDTSDSGGNVLRPNVVAGVNPTVGGAVKNKLTDYVNLAAFSQPAPFTFGDAPRTLSNVRGPGYHDIDFSGFKNFQPTEKINIQFRGEAFNLLNQVQFGLPNMTWSSGQFGAISSQANTPRQIQAALKILW